MNNHGEEKKTKEIAVLVKVKVKPVINQKCLKLSTSWLYVNTVNVSNRKKKDEEMMYDKRIKML